MPTGEHYRKAIKKVCLDRANRGKDPVAIGYEIQREAELLASIDKAMKELADALIS